MRDHPPPFALRNLLSQKCELPAPSTAEKRHVHNDEDDCEEQHFESERCDLLRSAGLRPGRVARRLNSPGRRPALHPIQIGGMSREGGVHKAWTGMAAEPPSRPLRLVTVYD